MINGSKSVRQLLRRFFSCGFMFCTKLVDMFLVTRFVGCKACTTILQVALTWEEQLLYCRRIELPFRETLTNCN